MNTNRKLTELNANILKIAGRVSKAIEEETEEVLEHAEQAVRHYVPARYVKRTLAAIEDKLDDEGVEVEFDKRVSRSALTATAGEGVTKEELDEIADKFAKAVIDELEEMLADGDEVMDEEVDGVADDDDDAVVNIEAKLKGVVERKLAAMGLRVGFARTAAAKVAAKKSVKQRYQQSTKAQPAKAPRNSILAKIKHDMQKR